MSEWFENQKKASGNLSKLLQESLGKNNSRRKLTAAEERRLSKLEAIVSKLIRGENVQNRQLQTWLNYKEYAQLEAEVNKSCQ